MQGRCQQPWYHMTLIHVPEYYQHPLPISVSSISHTTTSHLLTLVQHDPAIIARQPPSSLTQLVICSGDWPLTQEPQRGAVKTQVSRARPRLLIRCHPDLETARANPEGASSPARRTPGRLLGLGYACRARIRAIRQSIIVASSWHRSRIGAARNGIIVISLHVYTRCLPRSAG
jgi:hypothetical protein